jgi:hypothetical protein
MSTRQLTVTELKVTKMWNKITECKIRALVLVSKIIKLCYYLPVMKEVTRGSE